MTDINLLPKPSLKKKLKKWPMMGCVFSLLLALIILKQPLSHQKINTPRQNPHAENELNATPLKKMKWSGFLQQGSHSWGMVVLPSGKTEIIQIGMCIAEEVACIEAISEQSIRFKIKNHDFNLQS